MTGSYLSLCFFLVWLLPSALFGQHELKGRVVDSQTGEPIPYVNIGFIDKGIGTVSDEEGLFFLEWDSERLTPEDVIQFSSLGYKPLEVSLSEKRLLDTNTPTYLLTAQPEKLNEVVVTNAGIFTSEEQVGYNSGDRRSYGYWKDNIALGGELATEIKIRKGLRRLEEFTFEVWGTTSDSVLIRLNFYHPDGKQGYPGSNINKSGKNILFTVTPDTDHAVIPLREYDLFVTDDFIASLELVKVYGSRSIGLVLAASKDGSPDSYKKYASMDQWKILRNSAMAYQLKTTRYTEKPTRSELRRIKKNEARPAISGYIFNGMTPLPGVEIRNLNTGFDTRTNEKGHYQINADKGDLLRVSATGMKPLTIEVLEKKFVNITLERS